MKNKHSPVDPYTNGQHAVLPISACSKSLIIDSSLEEILQNEIFIENLILILSCKKPFHGDTKVQDRFSGQ
jgi:hypothetical protein